MALHARERRFDPHSSARAEELRGTLLAPFGLRFAAFAVDFVVAVLSYVAIEIAGQYLLLRARGMQAKIQVDFDFHRLEALIWLVLYFGLSIHWSNGLTLGKRLMRIRVVSLVHDRMTLWQSIERALGYGASMLEGGFGFFQYFLHHNRCCVHDRIAETIVVRDST